jgi:hypothetical protein
VSRAEFLAPPRVDEGDHGRANSDCIEADGIRLPSKRRAYTRGPDRRPITDMLMVSIDFSEVAFK